MKVFELLEEKFILTDFKSYNKEDIINELIDLHDEDENVIDLELIRSSVLKREEEQSTGVGEGFAVPHGKCEAVRDILVSFGKSNKPIDYNSLDGQPVHFIFLIVGEENQVGKYIKLLGRISRLMNKDDFRQKLIEAKSKSEILKIFEEEEKNYNDV